LLAPLPTPKVEDYPVSAVRNCLFNIFVAALHIGGHSFISNLRMCNAMVTGTNLPWKIFDNNIENSDCTSSFLNPEVWFGVAAFIYLR